MKRSRAFILSEQLMTIMLQASFIIVLCASFYQLISFYTRTQQVLTARNHAERVISFMDEKIRNAGLGLWRCKSSSVIRAKFDKTGMLKTNNTRGYKLPIAIQRGFKNGVNSQTATGSGYIPELSLIQDSGDIVTVLYAVRDLSAGKDQLILHSSAPLTLAKSGTSWAGDLPMLYKTNTNITKINSSKIFVLGGKSVNSFAVMEAMGYPVFLAGTGSTTGTIKVQAFELADPSTEEITIPAASELIALNCMQMFVQGTDGTGEGRQFAYRQLTVGGAGWDKTYNQEKGILDIYMEVDRDKNIFTLWVLASGGYDASLNNPRPDSWPKEASPAGKDDDEAKAAWLNSTYRHHIVYVSRAQWKLNNIPQGFTWN